MSPAEVATLSNVLQIVFRASERVLPDLIDSPFPSTLYHLVTALYPAVTVFWLAISLCVVQLFLSLVTQSYAWNDRFWSLIPPLFAVFYSLHPLLSSGLPTNSFPDARLSILSSLILIWGIRLTAHAIHRGVYNRAYVDYRYEQIRTIMARPLLFRVVYAVAVCLFTLLLTVASAPLHFAWVARDQPLNILDVIATLIAVAGLALETAADREQQIFHRAKILNHQGPEANLGFLQTGLFAHSRHPNFFGEMMFWCAIYIFSVSSGGHIINWTVAGPLGYIGVFQISTALTEQVALRKYPRYADYQRQVPRLWPALVAKSSPQLLRAHIAEKEK